MTYFSLLDVFYSLELDLVDIATQKGMFVSDLKEQADSLDGATKAKIYEILAQQVEALRQANMIKLNELKSEKVVNFAEYKRRAS